MKNTFRETFNGPHHVLSVCTALVGPLRTKQHCPQLQYHCSIHVHSLTKCLLLVVLHSGRGYSGFPVANLQRNASLQTREYNVSEASCRGGLEVCAIVDIRSSGRRVNITRGCMLIKCLPQDEPVPTPARNVSLLNLQKSSANCV